MVNGKGTDMMQLIFCVSSMLLLVDDPTGSFRHG